MKVSPCLQLSPVAAIAVRGLTSYGGDSLLRPPVAEPVLAAFRDERHFIGQKVAHDSVEHTAFCLSTPILMME